MMKEDLFQFIWSCGYFKDWEGHSICGKTIRIVRPGVLNLHSGPDFMGAVIEIDGVVWVGNVEMHIHAKDWNAHGHHSDKAYGNVILHVVIEGVSDILTWNGLKIPTIELGAYLPNNVVQQYREWHAKNRSLRCANKVNKNVSLRWPMMVPSLLKQRMEVKTEELLRYLAQLNGDWNTLLWIWIARAFGGPANALPSSLLAQHLSFTQMARLRNDSEKMEAVIMGMAGWLNDKINDRYALHLNQIWNAHKHVYTKNESLNLPWVYGKIRPSSAPMRRMAMWAALFRAWSSPIDTCLSLALDKEVKQLKPIPLPEYWQSRHRLGATPTSKKIKHIPSGLMQKIMLNVVFPFASAWYSYRHQDHYCVEILHKMAQLPPEQNRITRNFKAVGWNAKNAADSQAMLHLYNHYCVPFKCLKCNVGAHIIGNELLPEKTLINSIGIN
jgi:hypothetical protein